MMKCKSECMSGIPCKTVCQLLTDKDWTALQVVSADGLNIHLETCVYGSRVYQLCAFRCCDEHKKVLHDFFVKQYRKTLDKFLDNRAKLIEIQKGIQGKNTFCELKVTRK